MSVFGRVSNPRPSRSLFNLSYDKKMTVDIGWIYPVLCEEVVPGDHWRIGNQIVLRAMPMVAPILHEINIFVHYFFCPYRVLWDGWEDFITGGPNGQSTLSLPRWPWQNPSQFRNGLWDYLGFPMKLENNVRVPVDPGELNRPLDFPRRAYYWIWNEYYRDENLHLEIDYETDLRSRLLQVSYEKDYFTSALPWPQKGIAPAMPVSGESKAQWEQSQFVSAGSGTDTIGALKSPTTSGSGISRVITNGLPGAEFFMREFFNKNTVDLSTLTTFNINDLRLAIQIQKWLERNARSGNRYTEFCRAHWGVAPPDSRLQRPEYLGGTRSPVIVSEVLQTSKTEPNAPQGNLAGHGISADKNFVASYHAPEYGLVMGLMFLRPRSAYQQGIDRQWLRRSRFDFPMPEFVDIGEQGIERMELYTSDDSSYNQEIFGFQGRYSEMRHKRSMVTGDMRDLFNYWHLGRIFSDTARPVLNWEFLQVQPSHASRVFSAGNQAPQFVVNFGNVIRAARPIPYMPTPGFMDHR